MDGPFSQLMHTGNPFLRMAWKFQGVLIFFFFFLCVRMLLTKTSPRNELSKWDLSWPVLRSLLLASFGLIGMQSFLSWGATYTIMSHANLYSSLTSLLVITYRMTTCRPLTKYEIIGSIVAILGCTITTQDPMAEKVDTGSSSIFFGNFLSFLSSIFATVYILIG